MEFDHLIDIERLLTSEGKARTFGSLKSLVSSTKQGDIGLHGGLPPPECFPITGLSFTLADGHTIEVDALLAQQQYNISPAGLPSLRDWATKHVHKLHSPKYHLDVAITCSSSQAADILVSLLMGPGDSMLVEQYTYPHFLESVCIPRGCTLVPVPMDGLGIIPVELEAVLQRVQSAGHRLPKLLYTVPIGQNPTGAVIPLERKKEIYRICQQYDIMILEVWYLTGFWLFDSRSYTKSPGLAAFF